MSDNLNLAKAKQSNAKQSNAKQSNAKQSTPDSPARSLPRNQQKLSPRLKSGVRYWRSDITRQLHIGSRFSNYLLPNQIGALEVEPALAELSGAGSSDLKKFEVLLSVLESLSLIDYEKTEINYRYGDQESRDIATSITRSVAQESFLTRIRIESDGITRSPGVRDGGIRKVLLRRDFAIQIHGEGRIAFALLGTLIASGFDSTEIAEEIEIQSKDLIGGCINRRDIGMAARLKSFDLLNEASLYPEPIPTLRDVDLVVSIGSPLPEVLQEWNRRKIPQLFLDFESPGEIRIGPFVRPGFGACYNCVNIAEIEGGKPLLHSLQSSLKQEINPNSNIGQKRKSSSLDCSDLTAALATFASGAIALAVIQIADTGRSDLHQKTALYSMLHFLEPQITSWERSPRCGCNWS